MTVLRLEHEIVHHFIIFVLSDCVCSGRWACGSEEDDLTAVGVMKPLNNPQYLLHVDNPQTVYIVLQQGLSGCV